MKLYQALKLKNQLGSLIKENNSKIIAHTSHLKGKKAFDIPILIDEIDHDCKELVNLKVKIAKANLLINEKIYEISELKSQISIYKSINIVEGHVDTPRYSSNVTAAGEYESQLSHKQVDILIKLAKETISKLQEEIDEYNIYTDI